MRKTKRFVAVLALAACAPTIKQVAIAPTDIQAAERALQEGSSIVKGSALIRQRGGGVVTCAGNDVFLIPATPSASRELQRVFGGETGYVDRGGTSTFGGGTLVAPPEPNRRVLCDAQGFFSFARVQAGKWHIITSIVWQVGEQYQGGSLLATTEVAEGGEVEVVLNH